MAVFVNIAVAFVKIARVPWVGHIGGAVGIFCQFADFAFAVAAENAVHISDICAVHADEQIVLVVIACFKLNSVLSVWIDSVFSSTAFAGG